MLYNGSHSTPRVGDPGLQEHKSDAGRREPKEKLRRPASQQPEELISIIANDPIFGSWPGLSCLSLSTSTESVIESRDTRRLLDHYCDALSVKLPWVDREDNPWRTIVVPAALRSGLLLNAVLCMATEDLAWAASGRAHALQFQQEAERYQTRALQLLSRQLELVIASEDNRALHSEETIQLLAAVLLLCNLEMRKPESSIWKVHLKAAHTLIQSCFFTNVDSISGMARFLILKCSSLTAFACMSNFEENPGDLMDYASSSDDSEFIPILRILQRITLKNRQRRGVSTLSPTGPTYSSEGCAKLREDLIHARRKTSGWVSRMAHVSASVRADLEQVGEMFNLAGLIYGHQALEFSCCVSELESWGLQIIDHCGLFHQLPLFSQDVLWPLFIAGTTFGGCNMLQEVLATKIQDVAALSGHRNALSALAFLQQFWASQAIGRDNWINLAADWTQRGSDFIII